MVWRIHHEFKRNLDDKRASYSSDVSHHITYDSITGVSWNTCIGTKIICIYIFVIKKREKQDVWGIILRWLNPLPGKRHGSLTAIN